MFNGIIICLVTSAYIQGGTTAPADCETSACLYAPKPADLKYFLSRNIGLFRIVYFLGITEQIV